MRRMLGQISVKHAAEPWGFAQLAAFAKRLAAFVDLAAQILGAVAGGWDCPFGPAPDNYAPLPPCKSLVQRESPAARPEEADGEVAHLGIKHLAVAVHLWCMLPDGFIV